VTIPSTGADPVEGYLRELVARCADPPLIDQLSADDLRTPCGTASIARAALRWLLDKRPDVIAEQLRRQLAGDDWLVRYRVRAAGLDVWAGGFDPATAGTDSAGRTLTWARRASLTPIAELQRLRQYGTGMAS
jgi:hypothetical protein